MLFKKHLYLKQAFLKYLANIITGLHKKSFEKIELHIRLQRTTLQICSRNITNCVTKTGNSAKYSRK